MKVICANDMAKSQRSIRTRVCIIGAGAAGLFVAQGLSRRGIDLVVIEAGGRSCVESAEIGFDPVFTDSVYPGATVGRVFGFGGTTSRWGGKLATYGIQDVNGESSARR